MSDPRAPAEEESIDPRVKVVAAVALLAALYALFQHTSLAPFPHAADDFVGGLAVGSAISGLIGWFGTRR
ncbi:MAG: hypothetical protein M3068_04575 [Gemmatimonadota bacterium]|nr:hypothetical protein [Gemmatimonadota bacterium]